MALRAGYYGLKRKFARKINVENIIPDAAGSSNPLTAKVDIDNVYTYEKEVGAANVTPPFKSSSLSGITLTVDDLGKITLNGTATAAAVFRVDVVLIPGVTYILHGRKDENTWVGLQDPVTYNYLTSTQNADDAMYGFNNLTGETKAAHFVVRVGSGQTLENYKMSPMLLIDNAAADPSKYIPNAMTNRDLTVRSEKTKAAVNGILTAASGAADFAAFKTALAALSPVTRSAAPAERSLQVEEPVEDITKKTTKKSTKKEDS